MNQTIARAGSWAGFIAVVGIAAYHGSLMAVAGQRIVGSTDAATIEAYFSADGIAVLSVMQLYVLVPAAILFVAVREALAVDPVGRFLATIGLLAAAIELALIAVIMAAQAGLVVAIQSGEPGVGAFRFLDVLYNTGADVFEGAWLVAFGVAMRGAVGFPRWMPGLSLVAGALMWVKAVALWVGIPDQVMLPVAILVIAWFVGASVGLRRLGMQPRVVAATATA